MSTDGKNADLLIDPFSHLIKVASRVCYTYLARIVRATRSDKHSNLSASFSTSIRTMIGEGGERVDCFLFCFFFLSFLFSSIGLDEGQMVTHTYGVTVKTVLFMVGKDAVLM